MEPSKQRPPLRTYSKRVLKESYKPPAKRKRIGEASESTDSPREVDIIVEPVPKKRKAITDYFQPSLLSSSPSTPQSSIFSDLAEKHTDSPPSSPLPREHSPVSPYKARARRRVSTRPVLPHIAKMSDSDGPNAVTHSTRRFKKQSRKGRADQRLNSLVNLAETIPQSTAPSGDRTESFSKLLSEEQAAERVDDDSDTSSDFEMPLSDNVIAAPIDIKTGPELIVPKGAAASTPPMLIQQKLDLGAPTTVHCKRCGWVYSKIEDFDIRAHRKHHADSVHGVSVKSMRVNHDSGVMKEWYPVEDDGCERYIIAIDRNSTPPWRNLAVEVLERHTDKELGTEFYKDEVLWSCIPDPNGQLDAHWFGLQVTSKFDQKPQDESEGVPRFKVYLYIKNKRVVGCLLAERASSGFEIVRRQVKKDDKGTWPAIVKYETERLQRNRHELGLGVNKIWVHVDHRRQGYAKRLLDCARGTFIPLRKIGKFEVGFSQTTKLGSIFAEKYMAGVAEASWVSFDKDYLWLTYEEPETRFRF
ncbi:MAG: N-acetyltransferase O1 (Establishment of cohesion protein 1) [Claussenomyces sp. TS43310]|nr:MAG: N-acetyltransferase O1 (Establishment of cohesion protein 1) [Claussenomyces sp. TS43310]